MLITKALLMSLVFCVMGLVYNLIGYHALFLDIRKRINQVFFLICTSLAVWSVCYFFATNADSPEMALMFHKYSVLGWGFFYTLLYHFTLLMKDENLDSTNELKKWWLIPLYIPSVIFLTYYSSSMGENSFTIVNTCFGYTSVTPNDFMNMFFNIHCLLMSGMSIYNTYVIRRKTNNQFLLKWLKFFIVAEVIAMFFALVTDLFLIRFFQLPFLQLSVLWLFIPVLFLFFILQKSKLIKQSGENDIEIVFTDRSRDSIFRMFGMVYTVIGYFALFMRHSWPFEDYIVFTMCFVCGTFIYFIKYIFKKKIVQDIVITLIFILNLLLIHMVFRNSLAITVWAVYFCFVIITTIFESLYFSYVLTLGMLMLQLYYWHEVPMLYVKFSWMEYTIRIMMVIFSFSLIVFINDEYRKKTKYNELNIQKQEVVNSITTNIIDVNMHNISEKIIENLINMNKGFDFISSYYIRINPLDGTIDRVSMVSGLDSELISDYKKTVLHLNSEWFDSLSKSENIIEIFDVDNLGSEYKEIKKEFYKRGITGFYAIPIHVKGRFRGILGMEFNVNEHNKLMHFYVGILRNILTDIIAKVDSERILFHKANFDDVTGLNNKEFFLKEADFILRSSRTKVAYVIYVDIDNFKSINDNFGHSVGDSVLEKFGSLLQDVFGINCLITRFSGDEFEVLIPTNLKREEVEDYCLTLLNKLKNGIDINENNYRININIGIAVFPKDGDNIEILTKNADIAMNESKNNGFMRYHFCSQANKERVLRDAKYTDHLYNALENNELYLEFQPQIDIVSEDIVGAEILLRWNSSVFGKVSPYNFVPILEKNGEIVSVTEWIIEEAIKQQVRMDEMGLKPIKLSINLSVVQFFDTMLISKLSRLVRKYNFDTRRIEFEITESVAIKNNNDFVEDMFEKIKEMGFSIAIDDFGTGFSSLNRIQSLDIDKLKIDKSFVDGIGKDSKKEAIVDIVIQLAQRLEVSIIAEGVEDADQLQYLAERKCNLVQGYYYSKPMNSEEFEQYMCKFS